MFSSSSHPKAKYSIPSLVSCFKAKRTISIPKPLEQDHDAASGSSGETTNNENHGDHNRAHDDSYDLIHRDLNLMEEEVKQVVDRASMKINQAREKLDILKTGGSSEAEVHELKKAVAKLKSQIPSRLKVRFDDSKPHGGDPRHDVNKASDEIMDKNLYRDPKFERTAESEVLLNAFCDLPERLLNYLKCFAWFPGRAIIKKRVMIYLWMAHPNVPDNFDEDIANEIFDELIAKGFIEPVYLKSSLVPDSCRMSTSIHSSLVLEVYKTRIFLPNYPSDQFFLVGVSDTDYCDCLINIRAGIIDGGPEQFEQLKHLKILYLGRWQQTSVTHHIAVTNTRILHGLKNMDRLQFLSLRGISLIRELPSCIVELTTIKILDLRACKNLEVLPDGIGLLERLTHLDMSECYSLEYMPKSLGNLSNLEVLKGFHVRDSKYKKLSCTLADLSKLQRLRKLNVYTSMKDFPAQSHLNALKQFSALKKLTISWGGRSLDGETKTNPMKRLLNIRSDEPHSPLPSTLEKLDLRCFHGMSPPNWMRPANLKQLKKLYIKGGNLCHLGRVQNLDVRDRWNVEVLRLQQLSELELDSKEVKAMFPKLIYFHKVECPKLTSFPNEESVRLMNIKEGQAVARNGIMNLEG